MIVFTLVIQTVIDEMAGIDHSAGLEPRPFALRPGEIIAGMVVSGGAFAQPNRHQQEEFIGDGVFVMPVFFPPDAAAAMVVPAAGHIRENGLGGCEITRIAGQVIRPQPGQRPPAFIVVKIIEVVFTGIVFEGGGDHLEQGSAIFGGDDTFKGVEAVGGVPPAGGIPQTLRVVPLLKGFGGDQGVLVAILLWQHLRTGRGQSEADRQHYGGERHRTCDGENHNRGGECPKAARQQAGTSRGTLRAKFFGRPTCALAAIV